MKEHRSLEGLSLFSWAKAGKKCQASIIMGFYSGQVALATYKQTWLVEPPSIQRSERGRRQCSRRCTGFSMQGVHSRQQTRQPHTLQDRQAKEALQNDRVLKHTRLYHKILVLQATLVCVTGGAKLSGSLFVTVTLGQMKKLVFQSG